MRVRYRMKSQQRLRKKNMKVSESIRINTLNPTLTSWSRRACPKRKKRNREENYMTDKFKRIGQANGGRWEVVG